MSTKASAAKEAQEEEVIPSESELEHLTALYAELKGLQINSIGNLEVRIARLQ